MAIIKYDLTGFVNLRDGGGLPTGTGRVKTSLLFRSDQPSEMDASDVGFFRDRGLSAVIDLRSELEDHAEPSPFRDNGFNVQKHPIDAGSVLSMLQDKMTVSDMYQEMLNRSGEAFASAVDGVLEGLQSGSVLVHCTAGKDRTGLTIAMIQEMIGVAREDVISSYSMSQENLVGDWEQKKLNLVKELAGEEIAKRIAPLIVGSPPEALGSAFKYLEAQYGGAEKYLLNYGMNPSTPRLLREELLAD